VTDDFFSKCLFGKRLYQAACLFSRNKLYMFPLTEEKKDCTMTTAPVQGHQVPNSWVKALSKREAVQIKQSCNTRLPCAHTSGKKLHNSRQDDKGTLSAASPIAQHRRNVELALSPPAAIRGSTRGGLFLAVRNKSQLRQRVAGDRVPSHLETVTGASTILRLCEP